MEFGQKSNIEGVFLENMLKNPGVPTHTLAEIILIDKSKSVIKPVLYTIKKETLVDMDDYIQLKQNGYYSIDRNAFLLIGEVANIDKKSKIVLLHNGNTVGYTHLIMASGIYPPPHTCAKDEEFIAGLHALLDALRIRKNLPEAISSPEIQAITEKYRLPIKLSLEDDSIQTNKVKMVHPENTIKSSGDKNATFDIIDKRLYEVVL